MADDLPLLEWLRSRIWPLEAAHDPDSLRASASLGVAELLKGGTTTVLDMGTVHNHHNVFEVLADTGLRAISGKTMMDAADVPSGLRETTSQSLEESEALCDRWHDTHDGRLRYAFSPRFVLSCTEALYRQTAIVAREHRATLHTHAAEHPAEKLAVRAALGHDDVDLLAAWGFSGPDTVLAHGVQLSPSQRRALARAGTRIAHCPSANLKLGSGVAKVSRMLHRGIVVGLGADGAPCNNNLDMFVEMRHAALLAKRLGDPSALPARTVLRMATIDGARTLGLDDQIGSIETGKRADITVVKLSTLHTEPAGSADARIVYASRSSDVRHVIVDGKLLVRDGSLTTLDEDKVLSDARTQAKRVLSRAGLA